RRQTQTFSFNGEHAVSENGEAGNGRVLRTFYTTEIARARTFSLKEEAQQLWDRGMCKHLSPRDVLVIGGEGPIDNAFRYENEPVRHKIVDLLGDLYLVGCEVHGRFVAHKSGHDLNRRMCLQILRQMEYVNRLAAVSRSGG